MNAAQPVSCNTPRLQAEARRAPALAALRNFPRVTPASPPAWAARRDTTGAKARGYTYERKVGRVLAKLCSENGWKLWDHQWFVYVSGTDVKYFQPDFIVERPGANNILVEVKLTYVDTTTQCDKYLGYLKLFGLECFPVIAVRNLTPNVLRDLIVDDFSKATPGSVWHLWV
jgi:hypothetical protein